MLINIAARIVKGFLRFSREGITHVYIDLYVLPIKARIENKICLLIHKAVQCKKPLYLNEMLELREQSTISLRNKYNTWKLVENNVPSFGFTNTRFKCCAPDLCNTLPKTIGHLDNNNTFKKHLKTYIFRETFDLETKTIGDCFAT